MEIGVRQPSNSLSDFLFAGSNIEPKKSPDVAVEQASGSTRINDSFESLCSWRAWGGQRNADIESHRINMRAESIRINAVWDIQNLLTPRAEPILQEF